MKGRTAKIDEWYFGDYRGGFSGSRYNQLTYITIFIFLVTVALSTEESLSQVIQTLYIPYIYNLIELYFITDFVGKISNTWSIYNYGTLGFIKSLLGSRQFLDGLTLFFLVTNYFPNDSAPVISLYLIKVILIIYYSELRALLNRLKYIFTADLNKFFLRQKLKRIIYQFLKVSK